MALTKLMGQHFRLFEGSAAVAEAVSCQVQITGNNEQVNTKDSADMFTDEQMVSRGWSASVETLDVSVATLRKYIKAFVEQGVSGTSGANGLTIGWDQAAGDQNRTAQNANFARSGMAWLSSLSLSANNRQTCRLNLNFQGNGAIN